MAFNFPVLSHRFKWKLPGGIYNQDLFPLVWALLLWLEVNVNENMIRNLSLTFQNIAESAAKTMSFPQPPKSLDSLVKVFLDNRIGIDYILADQGGVCVIVTTTCCIWINISGEIEIQLQKITD